MFNIHVASYGLQLCTTAQEPQIYYFGTRDLKLLLLEKDGHLFIKS